MHIAWIPCLFCMEGRRDIGKQIFCSQVRSYYTESSSNVTGIAERAAAPRDQIKFSFRSSQLARHQRISCQ